MATGGGYSHIVAGVYDPPGSSGAEAKAKQTAVTKPQGTFYARAAQNLRGDRLEQRMLNATQEIAKHTKKTAELLKDGVGVSA